MDESNHRVRADSASSMESLDLEMNNLSPFPQQAPSLPQTPRDAHSADVAQRNGKLDLIQLEEMGVCERMDSDDETHLDVGMDIDKAPSSSRKKEERVEKSRQSSYSRMKARMRSLPLAIPGTSGSSTVVEMLSSPMSAEEDNGNRCRRRGPLNSLKRSRCLRLNFDKLQPCQYFLGENGQCTARKKADALTKELSKLREYLYIGDISAARNVRKLKAAGITHIVNMAGATCNNAAEKDFAYLTLTPMDCEKEDLACLFLPIAAFIDAARSVGGRVLVHCFRGISRSCAAALSYIMLDEGKSFCAAWSELTKIRPVAYPNSGFMKALTALEHWQRNGLEESRVWRMDVQAPNLALFKHYDGSIDADSTRNEVLVLENANRRGLRVYRGEDVCDTRWNAIVPAVDRFAEQLAKNRGTHPNLSSNACEKRTMELEQAHRILPWQFECN